MSSTKLIQLYVRKAKNLIRVKGLGEKYEHTFFANQFFSFFPSNKHKWTFTVTCEDLKHYYKWILLNVEIPWKVIFDTIMSRELPEELEENPKKYARIRKMREEHPDIDFTLFTPFKKSSLFEDIVKDFFNFDPCPHCIWGEHGTFLITEGEDYCPLHAYFHESSFVFGRHLKKKRKLMEESFTMKFNPGKRFIRACRKGSLETVQICWEKMTTEDLYNGLSAAIQNDHSNVVSFLCLQIDRPGSEICRHSLSHFLPMAAIYDSWNSLEILISFFCEMEDALRHTLRVLRDKEFEMEEKEEQEAEKCEVLAGKVEELLVIED